MAHPSEVASLQTPEGSRPEHDLRNVLYLVTSFAQLMREGLAGPVSQPQKEFLGHILDCAARAQELMAPARRKAPVQTTAAQS